MARWGKWGWAGFLLCLALACVLSGCGQAEPQKLWVLTDLDYWWTSGGEAPSGAEGAQQDFQEILAYFHGLPEDMEVELEVPPGRRRRAQRPSLPDPHGDSGRGRARCIPALLRLAENLWMSQERLFPNVEHALYGDFFLPLDPHLEKAQFLEWEKLTPGSDGGRPHGGGPVGFAHGLQRDLDQDKPGHPAGGSSPNLGRGDYQPKPRNPGGGTPGCPAGFPKPFLAVADAKREELLLTPEELGLRVRQVWENADPLQQTGTPVRVLRYYPQEFDLLSGEELWLSLEDRDTLFPLRNTQGGVSVYITLYGAVNRNTSLPQEAFTVLDMLLSREVLSGECFWRGDGNKRGFGIYLLGSSKRGVPVHEELFHGESNSVNYFFLDDPAFSGFSSARQEITTAYFPSNVDLALCRAFEEWSATPPAERETLVRDAYNRVWMMLEKVERRNCLEKPAPLHFGQLLPVVAAAGRGACCSILPLWISVVLLFHPGHGEDTVLRGAFQLSGTALQQRLPNIFWEYVEVFRG